jgi:hypothetical protein
MSDEEGVIEISQENTKRAGLEDDFWLRLGQKIIEESISSIEEAAKQIITAVSLLQAIFFAVISFKDFLEPFALQSSWIRLIIFLLPIPIWIASLYFSLRVFIPKAYNIPLMHPSKSREAVQIIAKEKHKQLKRAQYSMVLGFIMMFISIIIFLYWVKTSHPL